MINRGNNTSQLKAPSSKKIHKADKQNNQELKVETKRNAADSFSSLSHYSAHAREEDSIVKRPKQKSINSKSLRERQKRSMFLTNPEIKANIYNALDLNGDRNVNPLELNNGILKMATMQENLYRDLDPSFDFDNNGRVDNIDYYHLVTELRQVLGVDAANQLNYRSRHQASSEKNLNDIRNHADLFEKIENGESLTDTERQTLATDVSRDLKYLYMYQDMLRTGTSNADNYMDKGFWLSNQSEINSYADALFSIGITVEGYNDEAFSPDLSLTKNLQQINDLRLLEGREIYPINELVDSSVSYEENLESIKEAIPDYDFLIARAAYNSSNGRNTQALLEFFPISQGLLEEDPTRIDEINEIMENINVRNVDEVITSDGLKINQDYSYAVDPASEFVVALSIYDLVNSNDLYRNTIIEDQTTIFLTDLIDGNNEIGGVMAPADPFVPALPNGHYEGERYIAMQRADLIYMNNSGVSDIDDFRSVIAHELVHYFTNDFGIDQPEGFLGYEELLGWTDQVIREFIFVKSDGFNAVIDSYLEFDDDVYSEHFWQLANFPHSEFLSNVTEAFVENPHGLENFFDIEREIPLFSFLENLFNFDPTDYIDQEEGYLFDDGINIG